jgi:DNA-nicking Smr family endonuclease
MVRSTPRTRTVEELHHHPFRQLASDLRARRPGVAHRAAKPPPAVAVDGARSDEDLFRREMADVAPLPPERRVLVRRPSPNPAMPPVVGPDSEVVDQLWRLVDGVAPFDIADTTEFVEGAVVGIDPQLVRRLRSGAYAYQDHLDLHGMTAEQAKEAVDRFLTAAHRRGRRCVLIVHGRGLNSKDHVPVLKRRLSTWLARGPWARLVLAFTSARPCDGGTGALYVLLRRERQRRRPITVTEGARW